MILNVMKKTKDTLGNKTALFGLVTGPLTLASHLRGTKLFIDMFRDTAYTDELIKYCTEVARTMSAYFIEGGMDLIAVVDPVISQISPRHMEKHFLAPFQSLFQFIGTKGVLSSMFVCGDATKNLELLCKSNPDSLFVDENIDMVPAKKITDQYNVLLGGNIPLTTTLLHGTQQDSMQYVIGLLDSLDHDNLAIAPGCDVPYDCPPENFIGVQQAIHEPESVRQLLKNYEASTDEIQVDLPNYDALEYALIEVYTIDSLSCAACGYMKSAAMDMYKHFSEKKIKVVEHKSTEKETFYRLKKLGIKHLPSILINGKLAFESIIPNQEELKKTIQNSLK